MAVTSIPVPGGGPDDSTGTQASPGRDWPVAVATSAIGARCLCLPPGLITSCLCSDKLIGAVNIRKGSALGMAFVVTWYPQVPSRSSTLQ